MKEFTYKITDRNGIHARPAGLLAKKAAQFGCAVTVVKGERSANARGVISLMGLGISCGDVITIRTEGQDEETAASELESFLKENGY